MNRYWNLSEQERAALTREQVEAFLDVELMEQGIAKVEPPNLHLIEKIDIETTEYFEVEYKGEFSTPNKTGFVFLTADQAKEFIDAAPLKKDSDWKANNQSFAKPCHEMAIMPIQLPTEQAVLNAKVKLEEVKELKEANEKASRDYNKACEAVREAVNGVWEDWRECTEKLARVEQIRVRQVEYLQLCDDNWNLAMTFLLKVYDREEILKTIEWLEVNWPLPVEEEEPAVA